MLGSIPVTSAMSASTQRAARGAWRSHVGDGVEIGLESVDRSETASPITVTVVHRASCEVRAAVTRSMAHPSTSVPDKSAYQPDLEGLEETKDITRYSSGASMPVPI